MSDQPRLDPDLRACSGDCFVVWKKEICCIALEGPDGKEILSDYKRLEFHDIWDETILLDWLEPVIWEGEPALILHCHKEEDV